MTEIKVLFVCMGNICRSPLAHGAFEHLVARSDLSGRIQVDSAGTHAYHVGEPPDPRSQEVAERHRIDLSGQRARKVGVPDFTEFDYVLAMDRDNYHNLMSICPAEQRDKVYLFMSFAPAMGVEEVPDPYYGGRSGFDYVFDLVQQASQGLLDDIRNRHFS